MWLKFHFRYRFNMAAIAKKDADVHITFEDQQQINKFARNNAKMNDTKDEIEAKKKELQNLQDAVEEIEVLALEDDVTVPYQIGEVLITTSCEDATSLLEAAKVDLQNDIDRLEGECSAFKQILSDLKVKLYAKFGNNINLENEEES